MMGTTISRVIGCALNVALFTVVMIDVHASLLWEYIKRNEPIASKTNNKEVPKAIKPRSGFEVKTLHFLQSKGIKVKYESRRLPYTVPAKQKNYIPDFELPNGILVECKGIFDRETREKMLLAIEQNPDKDIRILFMRDNRLSKQSKTKYTDWCRKHNMKCAVSSLGHVPEEWIAANNKNNNGEQ